MKLHLFDVRRKMVMPALFLTAGLFAITPAACLAGPRDDYSSPRGVDCSTYQSAKNWADGGDPGPNPGDYSLEAPFGGVLHAHVLNVVKVKRGDGTAYLQYIRVRNVRAYVDEFRQKEVRLPRAETFTCWAVYTT